MQREVAFEKEPCGSISLSEVEGRASYLLESFPGWDDSGNRCFRLDGNGVSYFCRQDKADKSLYTIYDIILHGDGSVLDLFRAFDDKEQIEFDRRNVLPLCGNIVIDISGNGRTYPSVEVLAIGSRVTDVKVRNSQFPSVKEIAEPGHKGHFTSVFNRCLLKKTPGTRNYTLLNVFGPSDPEHEYSSYTMSRVDEIADYAMAGASIRILSAIHGNLSIKLNEHSFDGCSDAVYDKNGMITVGETIIDVVPGLLSVEIGNGRYTYINTGILGKNKVRRVVIDTYYFPRAGVLFADKIANLVSKFADKAEFVLKITNPLTNVGAQFFRTLWAPKKFSFSSVITSYDGYIVKDDIIYTKDGKTLVCAWNAKGDISIPEGVETIATAAFSNSMATSVALPKSLREIGECAFLDAENLQSIDLPEGLLRISDSAFEGSGIREISIPKSCEDIGQNALDCADVIRAYTGSKISIASTFRARETEGVVVIVDADTNKRYAFVQENLLMSDFRLYGCRFSSTTYTLVDTAWQSKDLDTFESEAGNLYSQVSRKYLDTKAKLAVFAFVNGYAPESAQTYAKNRAFDVALKCIENGDEKFAIEVIKKDGLLTKPALKKLLPAAASAGMVEAAAVISERTAPKAKKATRVISL